MEAVKLAVIGAGLVGRRHAEHVAAQSGARLTVIVDPSPIGKEVAEELGAKWFASFAALLAAEPPDGVIIATPNQLHLRHGLEAIAARIPTIIEKPIADSVAAASKLVDAAEKARIPLLVGHHRRYNPMVRKAKEIISSGRLGRVLALHASFWVLKPDDYFEVGWRREKGAGPVFLNLIHDVDLFRYLCGDVVSVLALESNAVRGNAVEESAVILLEFESGALGTMTISDAVVAPWSWELTAGENPAYPQQDQPCYHIGGTHGSLTIPHLELWSNRGKRSWWEPLVRERISFTPEDPPAAQIRHFCEVIRGKAIPIMPGREGLETLRVIEAVKQSARSGAKITITRSR
jgi:predicted dehydrogenase